MQIISPNDIIQIVTLLKQNKIVALPTDTCYGLMGNATSEAVVRKVFEIKGRDYKKPVSIICRNFEMIKKFAKVGAVEEKIIRKFLPGPLTIILQKKTLPKALRIIFRKKELPDPLHTGQGTVGVRMPKHPLIIEVMKYIDFPITATSANQSNESEIYDADKILANFKGKKAVPDAIVMAGRLPQVLPSTIAKVINRDVQILRRGPIKKEEILAIL